MKKATRRFLNVRPNAKLINKVEYRPHPESIPNHCAENAFKEASRSGNQIISGWLIGDYSKEHDMTPIMFHFWNIDKNGNHYDTTPEVREEANQHYDFVFDDAVYFESSDWSKQNVETCDIYFPPALKMRDKSLLMDVSPFGSSKMDAEWLQLSERVWSVTEMLDLKKKVMELA